MSLELLCLVLFETSGCILNLWFDIQPGLISNIFNRPSVSRLFYTVVNKYAIHPLVVLVKEKLLMKSMEWKSVDDEY